MTRDRKDQYLSAMVRFKKVGMRFPTECDIQWSELIIMQKICGCCTCDGENINVSEIHEDLFISKPAVSQTLNSLEKKGYIIREINTGDRRRISVCPTSVGEEVLKRSINSYDSSLTELFTKFGEENVDTLLRLLNELADIYENIDDE